MTNGPKLPFEVPAEMIALAEQTFAQARRAFDQFISAAQTTVETIDSRNTAAQEGAREITGTIMSYAEQNVANAFAYAEKLVHARDPQTLVRLHSEYVEEQMRVLGEQAKAVAEVAGKAATGLTRPKGE